MRYPSAAPEQHFSAVGIARAACALGAMLCAFPAQSQNAARGRQLYESRINANYLSCSDAACHGPTPAANINRIRSGIDPQAIIGALAAVPLMSPLRGLISAADAADLAAYVANPAAGNTGGGLASSASLLEFGSTAVGGANPNSNPAQATVTNTSTAPVTLSGISKSGTHAAEFSPSGTCAAAPVQLAPGASCGLGATFAPAAGGTRTAIFTLQSDAPSNPALMLSGIATAAPSATVALSRSTLTFPTQTVATTSAARDVSVRNIGTAPLIVSAVTVVPTPEFVSSSTCTGTLLPGGTCNVVVVFTPSAAGVRTGTVTLTANPGNTTIALAGNSVLSPTPIVTTSESALSLGSIELGSTPTTRALQVTNSGNAPLQISAVEVRGQDARDFALTGASTCKPGTIAPEEECRLEVEFRPASSGNRVAAVALAHNGEGGATTISLSGTSTAPLPPPASSSSAAAPAQGGAGSLPLASVFALAVAAATRRVRGTGKPR